MARSTEFRNAGSKFGSTIRQSLDLITGRNVNNYTLMFLDPTKQHRRGESKNIVVPYIVMGRNSSCHVQFGDEYPTVSRQHAAIQSDDKGCMLIHNPQATNPTYVDGRPISGYHSLDTGDEIQLSQDGPRIRFIMDKTAKTSTIGFTRRMSMAIGQSLRPYKRAIYMAGVLLIGIIGYSIWSTLKVSKLESEQAILTAQIAEADVKVVNYLDTLNHIGLRTTETELQISKVTEKIKEAQRERSIATQRLSSSSSPAQYVSKLLESFEDNIFYIHVLEFKLANTFDLFDEAKSFIDRWSGTGFLSSDGRFYTARHVVQPWFYPEDACSIMALINDYAARGGSIFIKYIAISPSGESFMFTGNDVYADQSYDKSDGPFDCDGERVKINVPKGSRTDYAYINVGNLSSNVKYDRSLSKNLDRGEKLYIHGYAGGLHLQDNFTLSPLFSEAIVAQNEIKNGLLYVTSSSAIGGNSGGPVFALRNNQLIVIGIVSATIDKSIGVIVPAANFK